MNSTYDSKHRKSRERYAEFSIFACMSLLLVDELKFLAIYIYGHTYTHIHDEIEFQDHTKNCTSILFDFTHYLFCFFVF